MKKLLVLLLCCLPLLLKSQALLDYHETVDGEVVEETPMFPGGIREMHKYIRQNMQYPEDARKMKIQGKAIVKITVLKDGSVGNVTIYRSTGNKSLDDEAVRLVRTMPKWRPGRIKGKVVNYKMLVVITFELDNEYCGTDSLHQVRYVTRYENLVEREPHLKTYPPTPREIHCQLIEMTDRIDMYDTEFYDSVCLARQNDTLERYLYYDMLSVSMLMANKRHYPKAYYDTYIILKELFKLDSVETVSDDKDD